MARWVTEMHRLLRSMLVAVHLSGGGPMRASEYGHLKAVATGDAGHERDLYVLDGEVVLMPHYRKNSHQDGTRLYPRILPRMVGEVVMVWLRLVLPLRTFVVERMGERWMSAGVWAVLGRRWLLL